MSGLPSSRMSTTGGCAAPQEDIVGLDDIVDKAKDLAGDAADNAKEMAGGVRDVAGDVADKAKDVAGDVADKAKDVAGNVAEHAHDLMHGDDDVPPASGGSGS